MWSAEMLECITTDEYFQVYRETISHILVETGVFRLSQVCILSCTANEEAAFSTRHKVFSYRGLCVDVGWTLRTLIPTALDQTISPGIDSIRQGSCLLTQFRVSWSMCGIKCFLLN